MVKKVTRIICDVCCHGDDTHDAGECWADVGNGKQCDCSWYEPIELEE